MPKTELPEGIDSDSAYLAPEFNDWNPAATLMEPNSKGVFQDTLELEPGREYQFRYVAMMSFGVMTGMPMRIFQTIWVSTIVSLIY